MREIIDERIKKLEGKYHVTCPGCGRLVIFATKHGALSLINRGNCRKCMSHCTSIKTDNIDIYQNESGKWGSRCGISA